MAPNDSSGSILERRRRVYGPNAALSYDSPIEMVRGEGAALFDAQGRRYLDCVNNVAHVGHANKEVVKALCSQLQRLNTNSRYLSEGLVDLSQQLADLMPQGLEVVYLVNSGSEANDLALRIARAAAAAAGRRAATHCAVVGGAYHGHLTSTMAMSPYKFWGQAGAGREPWVHVLPCPDPYRGLHLDGRAAARGAAAEARAEGGELCAFICESVLSCGGQVFLPDGYLAAVYEEMRAAGAVCIADEVQCGFGRVGDAFWGFELSGVVPDIVVMGKPIGNGFPLAAVVTTRALADAFAQQEYFNTYGGNNAATAAGLAVLSEIRRQRLQPHAAAIGARLMAGLRGLQARHPGVIGDVRGRGLFIGIDIVRDPATKQPAPATAKWLKERARERQVLLSTDGPYEQVIKIKPPMVFSASDADRLVSTLGALLDELAAASPEARAALAEAEEARLASHVAPIAARYADNAARIYAYAAAADSAAAAGAGSGKKAGVAPKKLPLLPLPWGGAGAGGSGSSSAGSECGGASPVAAAGGGSKQQAGKSSLKGAVGGGASLLRRVLSFASIKSEASSMSTGGDWEPAPRAAV